MDNTNLRRFSSKLLIAESPLLILPSLAKKIGLNEAIILQQMHYWISNPLNQNIKDERVWVYNTINEWRNQFPFWGLNTIIRAIESLEAKKLIITGQYNKLARDRTKWYTIDYDSLECLDVGTFTQNETFHLPKMGKSIYPKWVNVLPETTTKISTDIKKNIKKSFDTEFEEFWEAYSKKVSRHKCIDIYNKVLRAEGIELHKTIIQAIAGQSKEQEVSDALGIWTPLKKHPATWLNGRCWEDSFKTEGELREENRRHLSKLANQPGRISKTEQYHNINARVREEAARRVEAIERETEALEREIRNSEDSDEDV